jgi:Na+-transporting NADH:ubiquinone oxidoreductase subunit NqrB
MAAKNLIQSMLEEVARSQPAEVGRAFRVAVSPTEENTPLATVNRDGTVEKAALWDWTFWDAGNWS